MRKSDLCLKSAYRILLGKPFLQMRMPSSTPLHLSWCRTSSCSMAPKKKDMFSIESSPEKSRWSLSGHQKCLTRSFSFIGDDAAYKVWVSAPQVGHQLIQILLWTHMHIWLKMHHFYTFIFIDIIVTIHDI